MKLFLITVLVASSFSVLGFSQEREVKRDSALYPMSDVQYNEPSNGSSPKLQVGDLIKMERGKDIIFGFGRLESLYDNGQLEVRWMHTVNVNSRSTMDARLFKKEVKELNGLSRGTPVIRRKDSLNSDQGEVLAVFSDGKVLVRWQPRYKAQKSDDESVAGLSSKDVARSTKCTPPRKGEAKPLCVGDAVAQVGMMHHYGIVRAAYENGTIDVEWQHEGSMGQRSFMSADDFAKRISPLSAQENESRDPKDMSHPEPGSAPIKSYPGKTVLGLPTIVP